MKLRVTCQGCGTTAAAECQGCQPGAAFHERGCPLRDLDALVSCPPESGCCHLDHHHGAAAAACPGHPGPHGVGVPGCTVCRPLTVTILDLGVRLTPVSRG